MLALEREREREREREGRMPSIGFCSKVEKNKYLAKTLTIVLSKFKSIFVYLEQLQNFKFYICVGQFESSLTFYSSPNKADT